MIGCTVHCVGQVHAALAHRARASVIRVQRVLVRADHVVSDTHDIESVSSDHDLIKATDQQETDDQHDDVIKSTDQHKTDDQDMIESVDQRHNTMIYRSSKQGTTTVHRPRVSVGEGGVTLDEGLCGRDAATPYRRVAQSRRGGP